MGPSAAPGRLVFPALQVVLMHGSLNASVPALVALVPEFSGDVAWMLIITILWCLFAGWIGRSWGPVENDAPGDIRTGQLPS